jgi:hypothetical protein
MTVKPLQSLETGAMPALLQVSGLRSNGNVPERKKAEREVRRTSVPAYQFEQRME